MAVCVGGAVLNLCVNQSMCLSVEAPNDIFYSRVGQWVLIFVLLQDAHESNEMVAES